MDGNLRWICEIIRDIILRKEGVLFSVTSFLYNPLRQNGNGCLTIHFSTIPTNKSNTVKRVTKRHILTQIILLQ